MNIVLIGYRCSGKTAVGRLLAKELGRNFLDTDVLIEDKAGCSIEALISRDGWDRFRDIEKRTIKNVSERDNLVIATGGGAIMDEDNVKNLKRNAFVVWLRGDTDILKRRMDKDLREGKIRPSLTGDDPAAEIDKVLNRRGPLYQKAGDMEVDTSLLTIREVADSIIKSLQK